MTATSVPGFEEEPEDDVSSLGALRGMIEACRGRARLLAPLSVLEAQAEATLLLSAARGLREGPVARSGARSHRCWRLALAVDMERRAPLVIALGIAAAKKYAKIASEGS